MLKGIFWGRCTQMITNYIMGTVEYIENYFRVETIGAIVILTLIISATVGLLFLLFRSVSLWYWRVNEQVAALERINQKLEELNQAVPNLVAPQPILYEQPNDFEVFDEDKEKAINTANSYPQEVAVERDNQTAPQVNVQETLFVNEDKVEGFNVGKNGKIYSENELRQQIQF